MVKCYTAVVVGGANFFLGGGGGGGANNFHFTVLIKNQKYSVFPAPKYPQSEKQLTLLILIDCVACSFWSCAFLFNASVIPVIL